MNIIIGENGFIAKKLIERNKNKYITTSSKKSTNNLYLDLCNPEEFDFTIANENDFIIFLAAVSSPDECQNNFEYAHKINVIGTKYVIQKFLERGGKVLFFSSDVIYGNTLNPVNENTQTNPFGKYAQMKDEIEKAFENEKNFKVFRLSYVLSKEDKYLSYLQKCIEKNEIAEIFHPFSRYMIYIEDVLDAIEFVYERWNEFDNQKFNLCGNENISRKYIAECVNSVIGGLQYTLLEPKEDFWKARPKDINIHSLYLRELLRKEPIAIKDAVFKIYKEKNMGKKALITGFTGQVGSQMADFLLENTDYTIIGMMRWQEPMDNVYHLTNRINNKDRIGIYYADLNDYSAMARMISELKPDVIFHLAAQSFPKTSFNIPIETLQTNIIGTANLLETIRQLKEAENYDPVVHVCSSSEVYGRAKPGEALAEDTKFHGASPYSISKIGTDYLGQFYGEAYNIKTYVTRMGTHTGPRRSDVFFESTVAKQIALIEAGLQEPIIKVGNLSSVRTFQDARDAVRAYYLLSIESEKGNIKCGEAFNIAGEEAYKLPEVIDLLLSFSFRDDISVQTDSDRLRPIDADYQMFDNTKIKSVIDWKPEIPTKKMFEDLLNHWREEIKKGRVPLNR